MQIQPIKLEMLLHIGKKKKCFSFVLHAIIRNFATKNSEVTSSRQKKKVFFCFALDFS